MFILNTRLNSFVRNCQELCGLEDLDAGAAKDLSTEKWVTPP